MKRQIKIATVVMIAANVLVAMLFFFFRDGPRATGALRQDVYVWQRAWTQPVRDAVAAHATNFSEVVPLRAEISWADAKPQMIRVALDKSLLAETHTRIGLALRIGTYPGPFTTNDAAIQFISAAAASIVADAKSNGIALYELQMDFDCASSKLDGYGVWLQTIQRRVAPLPVTITALPSWLNKSSFARLASLATNYVLQVHSAERPKSFEAKYSLCDPKAARRAVERAGKIGVPFRVALPTYGYDMAFDERGEFISLAAEGQRPNWPNNSKIRMVDASTADISEMIRGWTSNRPEAMRGVIWYRMPVQSDQRNWSWKTLQSVMSGHDPLAK